MGVLNRPQSPTNRIMCLEIPEIPLVTLRSDPKLLKKYRKLFSPAGDLERATEEIARSLQQKGEEARDLLNGTKRTTSLADRHRASVPEAQPDGIV